MSRMKTLQKIKPELLDTIKSEIRLSVSERNFLFNFIHFGRKNRYKETRVYNPKNPKNRFNHSFIKEVMSYEYFRTYVLKYLEGNDFRTEICKDIDCKLRRILDYIIIYQNRDSNKLIDYLERPHGAKYPWSLSKAVEAKEFFLKLFFEIL